MNGSTDDLTDSLKTQSAAATGEASKRRYAETIYPLLAIKLQARNEAIGINGLTPQVAGLLELWFTTLVKHEQQRAAIVERHIVDLGLTEFELLEQRMKTAQTKEDRLQVLKQAQELMGDLSKSVENLEAISDVV